MNEVNNVILEFINNSLKNNLSLHILNAFGQRYLFLKNIVDKKDKELYIEYIRLKEFFENLNIKVFEKEGNIQFESEKKETKKQFFNKRNLSNTGLDLLIQDIFNNF